ncbi:MAG TPA: O-antigen ligase family protein [Thermoleophilaceae bacterium]|nr:O-antigen ligase family protein [Thermoleophilaceae bacterium]
MTSRILTAPRRTGGGGAERIASAGAIGALSAAVGLAAGAVPVVLVGLTGLIVGALATMAWPGLVLFGTLLVRPSLDSSGSLISLGSINLAGVIAGALCFAGGLALLVKRPRLPAKGAALPFLLLLALALLSVSYAPEPADAFRTWVRLGALIVLFWLAVWVTREVSDLQRIVTIILASAVLPIAVGLWQLVTGSGLVGRGQGGASHTAPPSTFVHPNGFAFFLLIVVALGLVALLETRDRLLRAVLSVGLAIATACLFFTYTRSAWVGLAVLVILVAAMEYRRLLGTMAIGAVLALLALPSFIGSVERRFQDLSGSAGYTADSLEWRTENWSRMFPYAQESPLTGHGLASYLPLSRREFHPFEGAFVSDPTKTPESAEEGQPGVGAHNDYVEFAVELGYTGALLWIATLVVLAAAMLRARKVPGVRPYATAAFAVIAVFMGISAFDHVRGNGPVVFALAALCGGIVGVSQRSGRNEPPTATG